MDPLMVTVNIFFGHWFTDIGIRRQGQVKLNSILSVAKDPYKSVLNANYNFIVIENVNQQGVNTSELS